MNVLIGDIGNTYTKICLVELNSLKIKKIIFFNSKNITSVNFLKQQINKILINKPNNV